MPPGPAEPPAAFFSFWCTASTRTGSSPAISAPSSSIACAKRAGQRAAEIGDADPLGAGIGLDPQGHDRALAVRVFRRAGERLVGRQFDDLRLGPGNLHRVTIGFGLSGSCPAEKPGGRRSVSGRQAARGAPFRIAEPRGPVKNIVRRVTLSGICRPTRRSASGPARGGAAGRGAPAGRRPAMSRVAAARR